jgi:hypothetical protein
MSPSLIALRGVRAPVHVARITYRTTAARCFGRSAMLRSGKEDELRTLFLSVVGSLDTAVICNPECGRGVVRLHTYGAVETYLGSDCFRNELRDAGTDADAIEQIPKTAPPSSRRRNKSS